MRLKHHLQQQRVSTYTPARSQYMLSNSKESASRRDGLRRDLEARRGWIAYGMKKPHPFGRD